MKKLKSFAVIFVLILLLNSCATVLISGKATECQRTKPAPGQPQREVRVGWLIADVLLFWPGIIVDFATAKIYHPCNK